MIIAVLGEKGGTGKTTFTTNLAGMRAAASRDVLMIDADRQGLKHLRWDRQNHERRSRYRGPTQNLRLCCYVHS